MYMILETTYVPLFKIIRIKIMIFFQKRVNIEISHRPK